MEISPGLDLVWTNDDSLGMPRVNAHLNGIAFASVRHQPAGWSVRWLQIPWQRKHSHLLVKTREEAAAIVEQYVRVLGIIPWGEASGVDLESVK
jgi:hypothetical protein